MDRHELGGWIEEVVPDDAAARAIFASVVANLSLLPLSRLVQAHELVLTLEAATMGDALGQLETVQPEWSAIDGFDELMTIVDGIAEGMD